MDEDDPRYERECIATDIIVRVGLWTRCDGPGCGQLIATYVADETDAYKYASALWGAKSPLISCFDTHSRLMDTIKHVLENTAPAGQGRCACYHYSDDD